jgi:hypothetical protein
VSSFRCDLRPAFLFGQQVRALPMVDRVLPAGGFCSRRGRGGGSAWRGRRSNRWSGYRNGGVVTLIGGEVAEAGVVVPGARRSALGGWRRFRFLSGE